MIVKLQLEFTCVLKTTTTKLCKPENKKKEQLDTSK